MMRQREEGICSAYSKADGSCYALPRSEYPRLLSEWMAGRAFYTCQAFYGGEMTIKLGDIVAVCDTPPEAIEAARDDNGQNEKEDAVFA